MGLKIVITFLLSCSLFAECSSEYAFAGKHFFASYLDCDVEALTNLKKLEEVLDTAVKASNATILSQQSQEFSNNGFTALYLLSESHASIHTYPEVASCFVDLFTCGNHCTSKEFDRILRAYLKPKRISLKLFSRTEEIEDKTEEEFESTRS